MARQEKGFTLIGTISSANIRVTSLTYLTAEILLIGTAVGELLFVEGSDLKANCMAETTNVIDLTIPKDALEQKAFHS